MLHQSATNDHASHMSGPAIVDLTRMTVDLGAVRTSLDTLAIDLSSLWRSTLATGDFCDIDRILGASHAVHQAVVALREDTVIPSW